jgi:hypothetical protein
MRPAQTDHDSFSIRSPSVPPPLSFSQSFATKSLFLAPNHTAAKRNENRVSMVVFPRDDIFS